MTVAVGFPRRPLHGTALWASHVARWIPALMLAYGMLIWPLIYGRSVDGGPPVQILQNESSALSQIYFPFLLVVSAFTWIATRYGRGSPIASGAIFVIALVIALSNLSVLWSIAPEIALRRAILQTAIVATLILSVQAADDPDGVVARIFWLLVAIMAVNLAAVAMKGPGPLGYEGVYPQKNGLGAAASLAIIVALYQLFSGRPITRLVACGTIILAMFLLVLSKSKTSFGLVLLVPCLALGIAVAARAMQVSAATFIATMLAIAFAVYQLGVASYVWDFSTVAEALFGDPTLTTRTDIWDFAMRMAERRPLLGYGFESFWQAGPESPAAREAPGFIARMPHAHNGYIDILLQLGIVGLGLVIVMQFAAFGAADAALRRRFGLGWLCLCLMLLAGLRNFMESSWFRGFDMFSMIFVIMVALAASIRERRSWNT